MRMGPEVPETSQTRIKQRGKASSLCAVALSGNSWLYIYIYIYLKPAATLQMEASSESLRQLIHASSLVSLCPLAALSTIF